MKFWPRKHLVKYPEMCRITYVPSGKVIVKNNASSSWLYIVRSGVCKVYMYMEETSIAWCEAQMEFTHHPEWPSKYE